MMRGTYIGPIQHLVGKTALLRAATHDHFVAQFDDRDLTLSGDPVAEELNDDALGYGWHAFPTCQFEEIKS